MNVFGKLGDKGISLLLHQRLETKIKRYGKLEALDIDSGRKIISFAVRLHGEEQETRFFIENYTITQIGDKYYFNFKRMHSSRLWITRLIEDKLNEWLELHQLEIPTALARLAKTLM
jgi:hypothetical protein